LGTAEHLRGGIVVNVSVYRGERSLSALARRLYEGSRADLQRGQDALLEANPRLRDLSKVAEGSGILVPEIEGATRTDESMPLESAVAAQVASAVQDAWAPIAEQLTASAAVERARADQSLQVVKARQVKAAAKTTRRLGKAVTRVQAKADERNAFAASVDTHVNELDALVASDVARLLEALGGGPPV
jgi:hypothetical protein